MALDTKYRPRRYEDVLGQESSARILRQLLKEGKGYHQSYVFCGQHGSGKTTMGRILARALLCSAPVDGDPCDACDSCRTILDGKTHECFMELDAATKSSKEDMLKITEDIQYSSFSGKRRIYLFDESHRLSKQALDAVLKPMEDCVPGSEDKQLVCIFCTTEPEKMQATIFSRCAPAFVIKAVAPEVIAERLSWVCGQESIKFDLDALVTIAEVTECHIRDALKTLEGASVLGPVTVESVSEYLKLGANDLVLDLIEYLGEDQVKALEAALQLSESVSPSSAYERIADAALSAYRSYLGVGKIPAYWKKNRIQKVSEKGARLLEVSNRFSSPPKRPTSQTVLLDTASVHNALANGFSLRQGESVVVVEQRVAAPSLKVEVPQGALAGKVGSEPSKTKPTASAPSVVSVDPRAVGSGSATRKPEARSSSASPSGGGGLDPMVFRDLLNFHLSELSNGSGNRSS